MVTGAGSTRQYEPARVDNFSLAFKEMCHFVAISHTRSVEETLRRLVLQCFVILPNEHFTNAAQVAEALKTLFGLHVSKQEVQLALDTLLTGNQLSQPNGTNIVVPAKTRQELEGGVQDARALESRVKEGWLRELATSTAHPPLNPDDAWRNLQNYLAKAFRRHGIQATALLDPSIDADPDSARSLSSLLEECVSAAFPPEQRESASAAVSRFLASAGGDPDRAAYVSQLADGAFSYFVLTVSPDVAERFRAQLRPLLLLLDTNFLFDILGLSYTPFVDVSNNLVDVTRQYTFPFKLRYHEATRRELVNAFRHYADRLKERRWARHISRAAIEGDRTLGYLSGIERVYHKRNADSGIAVAAFLAPYEHLDIILKDRGIDLYNPRVERLQEITDLHHEYEAYLVARGVDKPYDTKWHDATILDCTRQQRSRARSSLDAGALLLTNDGNLFRFDWDYCRKHNLQPCTVLPNLLWQLLRPFIPSNPDFDRSFAETFAIPEFRTALSGAASEAAHRLLNLLAGYSGVREETAAKMLSNDLLLDGLSKERNQYRFQELVDQALVFENTELMEENAALTAQLEQERLAQHERDRQAGEERERVRVEQERHEAQAQMAEQARRTAEAERQAEATQHATTRARLTKTSSALDVERKSKEEAEQRAEDAEERARQSDLDTQRVYDILRAAGFTVLFMVVDLGVTYGTTWGPLEWLRTHQNSYGIQLSLAIALFSMLLAVFRREWRGPAVIAGVLGAALIIAQLLGGPPRPSSSP